MSSPVLVLLAEDHLLVQMAVEVELGEAGYDLAVASSGVEAKGRIEAGADRIQALVTNVDLGKGPSGWDIARRARELIADLPVVYITAGWGADWPLRGVPNSILVPKPFRTGQIVAALSTLLHKHATAPAGQGSSVIKMGQAIFQDSSSEKVILDA